MKKRKKTHKFITMIIIITIGIVVSLNYDYIKSKVVGVFKENNKDKTEKIEQTVEIINTKETDANIIEKYFAEGMNANTYTQVINTKTEYLKETGEYKQEKYNFDKLLTYKEIENIINNVNNSEVVNTEIIGASVDGRNIYSIEIGNGSKTIMFEGNIHAAEVASPMYLMSFITNLIADYENKDKDTMDLLNDYKLVVVPSINPDGYTMTLFGVDNLNNKKLYAYKNRNEIDFDFYKANANGVDINRNFPSQHGGLYYKDTEISNTVAFKPSVGALDYFAGDSLGSEPETKALIYWINKHIKNAYSYVALHSAGRVIYNGKPNLSNEFNNISYDSAEIVNHYSDYVILGSDFEEVGTGNDGTSTDYVSELASGFKFSSETGRLSTKKYDMKTTELKYKVAVITVETLSNFSFSLSKIKNEYNQYNFEKIFLELINTNYE